MDRPFAWFIACSLSLFAAGCGTAGSGYDDPNEIGVGGDTSFIDPSADTDMDGVPDVVEGSGDLNQNGIPAHLDPDEQGGGGSGPTDGAVPPEGGGAGSVPFGQACSATDTCANVGGVAGCCSPSGTCGGSIGGDCQAGMLCGGSAFCGGDSPCCTPAGVCGQLAADATTCEVVGGGVDAGVPGTGDGGGGPVDTCPMVGSEAGCCADDGKCGVVNSFLGCLPASIAGALGTSVPDLDCTP